MMKKLSSENSLQNQQVLQAGSQLPNKRCTNQLGWLLRNCPRQIGNYLFSAVHYLEQWHSGEFEDQNKYTHTF